MTLKLNGSDDGSVSIDAPADTSPSGSDITLTLPTTVGSANQFVKNGSTAGSLEYSSMTEDSSGDVQISSGGLEITPSGTDIALRLRYPDESAASSRTALDITADVSGSEASVFRVMGDGRINLGDSSSTNNVLTQTNTGARLHISAGGAGTAQIDLYGQTHSSSPKEIRMSTNSVERLKITNTGHAEFRAASYVVEARSIAASSSSNCLYSGAHSSTGFGLGTITYEVYTNGNVKNTNNSYGQLSDVNLKENIVDATSQWDDIKSLQIRKYNFREATGYDTHTQIGLVAQEVETVCPGLVQTTAVREDATPVLDADGNALETIKSVSTSVLYMKAVKALQEAMTRIETLETKVAALEAAE